MLRPSTTKKRGIQSVPHADCPAKTQMGVGGQILPGLSVVDHCHIVGEVAGALIHQYPSSIREALFPDQAALVAACHDIGKVSPSFYEKIRRACTAGIEHLPVFPDTRHLEKAWGGHAGVSQVAAAAMKAPRWVPDILGQHHGFSPSVAGKRATDEVFGGPLWQKQRCVLVEELKQRLGMDWPYIESPEQARLVAGLTSVADWIGSGPRFQKIKTDWLKQIPLALKEAGFVPPAYQSNRSFKDVFGFTPWPIQENFVDAVSGPGVYVLEAPMGLGKTEAALYAAYGMLQSKKAVGVYFALPTQLTSNRIHQRFNAFLDHVLAPDCAHRALLLHGKAWLQETEMGEEGQPGGAWFHQAKRGLLAPFAVGTIDQALMAVMNVKHGFVRAFGLAGKVVILDEVHTYDAYTSTLLNALVELLRSLHCTVIILSATLNQERRRELLGISLAGTAYPLITAVAQDEPVQEVASQPPANVEVSVVLLDSDHSALQEALRRASEGQQVLWIENTVQEAQERYLDLAARASDLGICCGLLHSRYTVSDRQAIEDEWVDRFGKKGWATRGRQGSILVGTQVLEQSLDIDADFLVSRFAPTDMLLQRLGRLWRHQDTPRPATAVQEVWLLAPDLDTAIVNPVQGFGATAFVYAPYLLCRSLEVWQSVNCIDLPGDIRDLIEQTYASRDEQAHMARWQYELDHGSRGRHRRIGRLGLQQLARVGLAQDGKTLPESKAQTRYSDSDTHEVLVLRRLSYLADAKVTQLTLLNGQALKLPIRRNQLTRTQWKAMAARLMQEVVAVNVSHAPVAPSREHLEKLGFHHCFYLGDRDWPEDECLLRLAFVDDETSAISGLHGATASDAYQLEYRHDLGYRAVKR